MTDEQIVRDFETCAITADDWTHECHLRVACAYLRTQPREDVFDRIRTGLKRLNAHLSVPERIDSGYHETITVAWTTLIAKTMDRDGPGADAVSFLAEHLELLDKRVLLRFYSRARIMSWEAKRRFVEPDLGPIEPLDCEESPPAVPRLDTSAKKSPGG